MAVKESSIKPMRDSLKSIEAQLKNPTPTPPVGTPVVWYSRALVAEGAEIAATCTKIEGAGKITVTTWRPQGMPDPTKRGCLHITHKTHLERHNAVSKNSGAWDYPQFSKIPKEHYQVHIDELNRRKEALIAKIEQAEASNISTESSLDDVSI